MSLIRHVKVGNQEITFEFNRFAKQAGGSVMVTSGGTKVLVTVCGADETKEGQDFFPLTVDYIEKFYAAGRIPGGYLKREAKPSDREILTSRVIDRPLRPSFPENYLCDTFVTAIVMAYDTVNTPAPLALIGASTALMISDIPFNGPIAALRIGLDKNGEFILDPAQNEPNDLDLNVAANPNALLMVEAGANFLSEEKMIEALNYGHKMMKPLFDMQLEVQKEIGKTKRQLPEKEANSDLGSKINQARAQIIDAFTISDKKERGKALKTISSRLQSEHNSENCPNLKVAINEAIDSLKSDIMRGSILENSKRIDGRGLSDIRQITCDVGILGRPHGSSMFTRGETQAIAIATLGSADDALRMDSIFGSDQRKKFMLHYNFPPFSVGEARPLRPPGRREIGHGTLAERALERVLPTEDEFGYTIRLVSEVLESNGSSSMATVCAGTMALLDAGVPIKEPIAGIAMGLIMGENNRYAVLSDILGDEDHLGDMDFKVCGSERGITALQMDIKLKDGLSAEVLEKALHQAKEGRIFILKKLTDAISTPGELSDYAPRIFQIKIKSDKIRDLIGPGGKTIKRITAETGVKIDIDDSGIVNIISPDSTSAEVAKKLIREITSDPEIGGIYLGTVKKVADFGCFVEIKPGTEGLCHISQLENRRIDNIRDFYNEGDEMMVKVLEIDNTGRIKLSRKDALDKKPTA